MYLIAQVQPVFDGAVTTEGLLPVLILTHKLFIVFLSSLHRWGGSDRAALVGAWRPVMLKPPVCYVWEELSIKSVYFLIFSPLNISLHTPFIKIPENHRSLSAIVITTLAFNTKKHLHWPNVFFSSFIRLSSHSLHVVCGLWLWVFLSYLQSRKELVFMVELCDSPQKISYK